MREVASGLEAAAPSGVSIILFGARHSHDGRKAMKRSETEAGTPIIEFTPEEYDDFLEREVRRGIGMSRAEFVRAYTAGELDDADAAVGDLVVLLRIGQNGHRAVA